MRAAPLRAAAPFSRHAQLILCGASRMKTHEAARLNEPGRGPRQPCTRRHEPDAARAPAPDRRGPAHDELVREHAGPSAHPPSGLARTVALCHRSTVRPFHPRSANIFGIASSVSETPSDRPPLFRYVGLLPVAVGAAQRALRPQHPRRALSGPGRLSHLSVFRSNSTSYGGFVWARAPGA